MLFTGYKQVFIKCCWMASLLLTTPCSLAIEAGKPDKLFSNTSEMQITLSAPWRDLKKAIKKDIRYPATLTYTDTNGQSQTISVEVAPRGITRRFKACSFPPLKVYFDKEKMKGTIFRGNKSLKLVTYCQKHSRYEQYYIKEFFAYRIYNLITDFSFRVKPLLVEYKDSKQASKGITRFSFFIEDIDAVAKRNKLEKLSAGRVLSTELDPEQGSNFSLFQLLIGNVDWSATSRSADTTCCHNSRIIGSGVNQSPKYAIPYDFDGTGLVDAHYAAPPNGINIRTIRQRLYRGYCVHNSPLPMAAARFQQQKPAIKRLFTDAARLDSKTRRRALEYIDGFYAIIDSPQRFQMELIDKCRR